VEIEYEEETIESGLLYFIKKHKVKLIILTAVSLFFMIICYGCYKTILPTDWHHFNAERIEFVEDKYKISLDNVEPDAYKEIAVAQDGDSVFFFEVDDFRKFMDNDFHGKEIKKSYEEPDGSHANYECRIDERLCCIIKFTKAGSRYKGELRCYRDALQAESSTLPYSIYSNG
jgi:hypothetical protein